MPTSHTGVRLIAVCLGAWMCQVAGTGCLLDLDTEPACGDGYVDDEAGEACDPGEPDSFAGACATVLGQTSAMRTASCDPRACTLDLSGCFGGCGNELLDPGEECEPGGPHTGPVDDELGIGGVSCLELPPLDSRSPYAGGTARVCTDSCLWDRAPCHRCGDERLQPGEVCDGELDDFAAVDAFCLGACVSPAIHPRPESVVCAARCADDCNAYESGPEGLGCCIPNGAPVHPALPCCGFADAGTCRPGLGG